MQEMTSTPLALATAVGHTCHLKLSEMKHCNEKLDSSLFLKRVFVDTQRIKSNLRRLNELRVNKVRAI